MSGGILINITFQDAMAQILSTGAYPRTLVRWKLSSTNQNISNLKFVIYRGESEDELVPISEKLPNNYEEYVDTMAHTKTIHEPLFYQVVAREYKGNHVVAEFKSDVFSWQMQEDPVGLYIVEEHEFKYRHIAGVPVIIVKRSRFTSKCPECYDSVLKRVTKSNCQSCFGSGTIGSYNTPIPTWMDMNPDNKVVAIADFGEKAIDQRDGELTNYPVLDPSDIIIEVMTNERFRVEGVYQAEKRTSVIRQLVRLSRINPSNIEYSIPVDDNMRKRLVDEFNEVRKIPEF